MGGIDQLVSELRMLAGRIGLTSDADLARVRREGPPTRDADVEDAGRFGVSIFMSLALTAQQARQPLLLDY